MLKKLAVEQIIENLPQMHCTRCGCGYNCCRAYAEALMQGASLKHCPVSGKKEIQQLARL